MRYIISLLLTSASVLPAMAEGPAVVTDIPPVHSIAAAVMGDLGAPQLLLDQGASPHGFQMKHSQMLAVADADLVLWMGPTLSPWLDKALDSRPEGSTALDLLAAPETYRQDFGAQGDHDHKAHSKGEAHDHTADQDHSGHDPHAWLDPANGKAWAALIATELSRLDPRNAATYAANAAKATAAIDAADQQAAALLAPVKDRPFVTFHDAYGYFTSHYGLSFAGAIAAGDAASPGARHLTELQASVGAMATICLFPEAQHDPALLTRLAEATGARTGGALDPEGSTLSPGPALYPALILGLAETMAACAP